MITTPSVLILGAGASKPYGYPTGAELLPRHFSWPTNLNQLLRTLGITAEGLADFQTAFWASGLSIDAFLERRDELRTMGRTVIAARILHCESASDLYPTADHWYELLINKLDAGPFSDIEANKVTIVTFNYDKSLEQYLFTALCNRHKKSYEEVALLVSKLPIIHVYGDVGPLDWQSDTKGRKYGSGLVPDEVKKAAESINIIAEGRDDSTALRHAREAIERAEKVFFLGFGFHADNMKRLGFLAEPRPEAHKVRIVGSA
jgi:hypothetical protein